MIHIIDGQREELLKFWVNNPPAADGIDGMEEGLGGDYWER